MNLTVVNYILKVYIHQKYKYIIKKITKTQEAR